MPAPSLSDLERQFLRPPQVGPAPSAPAAAGPATAEILRPVAGPAAPSLNDLARQYASPRENLRFLLEESRTRSPNYIAENYPGAIAQGERPPAVARGIMQTLVPRVYEQAIGEAQSRQAAVARNEAGLSREAAPTFAGRVGELVGQGIGFAPYLPGLGGSVGGPIAARVAAGLAVRLGPTLGALATHVTSALGEGVAFGAIEIITQDFDRVAALAKRDPAEAARYVAERLGSSGAGFAGMAAGFSAFSLAIRPLLGAIGTGLIARGTLNRVASVMRSEPELFRPAAAPGGDPFAASVAQRAAAASENAVRGAIAAERAQPVQPALPPGNRLGVPVRPVWPQPAEQPALMPGNRLGVPVRPVEAPGARPAPAPEPPVAASPSISTRAVFDGIDGLSDQAKKDLASQLGVKRATQDDAFKVLLPPADQKRPLAQGETWRQRAIDHISTQEAGPVTPPAAQSLPAAPIPATVVRVSEQGQPAASLADVSKPHGLYTSPADVESPHADLGGPRVTLNVNPNANVLHVDTTDFISSNRGSTVGTSSGLAALKSLAGETETNAFLRLRKSEAIQYLEPKFPGVDFTRYYDTHELGEAYGGILARQHGYDALWGIDRHAPEFNEYVGLTPKAFRSATEHPVIKTLKEQAAPTPAAPFARLENLDPNTRTSDDIRDLVYVGTDEQVRAYVQRVKGLLEQAKQRGDSVSVKNLSGDLAFIARERPAPPEGLPPGHPFDKRALGLSEPPAPAPGSEALNLVGGEAAAPPRPAAGEQGTLLTAEPGATKAAPASAIGQLPVNGSVIMGNVSVPNTLFHPYDLVVRRDAQAQWTLQARSDAAAEIQVGTFTNLNQLLSRVDEILTKKPSIEMLSIQPTRKFVVSQDYRDTRLFQQQENPYSSLETKKAHPESRVRLSTSEDVLNLQHAAHLRKTGQVETPATDQFFGYHEAQRTVLTQAIDAARSSGKNVPTAPKALDQWAGKIANKAYANYLEYAQAQNLRGKLGTRYGEEPTPSFIKQFLLENESGALKLDAIAKIGDAGRAAIDGLGNLIKDLDRPAQTPEAQASPFTDARSAALGESKLFAVHSNNFWKGRVTPELDRLARVSGEKDSRVLRGAMALYLDGLRDPEGVARSLPEALSKWPELQPYIDRMNRMTPDERAFAHNVIDSYDQARGGLKVDQNLLKEAMDYHVTHLWESAQQATGKTISTRGGGKLNPFTPFSEKRTIPTFVEGIANGYRPRTLDIVDINHLLDADLSRAILARQLRQGLEESGAGAWSFSRPTPDAEDLGARLRTFRRDIPSQDTATGQITVREQHLWVDPGTYKQLAFLVEGDPFRSTGRGLKVLQYFDFVKFAELFGTFFHDFNLAKVFAFSHPIETLKGMTTGAQLSQGGLYKKFGPVAQGLEWLSNPTPEIDRLYRNGLLTGQENMADAYARTSGEATSGARQWVESTWFYKARSKALWDTMHSGLKVYDAVITVRNSLADQLGRTNPKTGKLFTKDEIFASAASAMNKKYGGLNWDLQGTTTMMKRIMRLFMLAPDWTISNIKFGAAAFEGGLLHPSPEALIARQSIATTAVMWTVALQGLNMAFNQGQTTFQSNERGKWYALKLPWKSREGRDLYADVLAPGEFKDLLKLGSAGLSMFSDKFGDPTDLQRFAQAKASPALRAILLGIGGVDWTGRQIKQPGMTTPQLAGTYAAFVAKNVLPVPFPVSAAYDVATGHTDPTQSAVQMVGGGSVTRGAIAGTAVWQHMSREGKLAFLNKLPPADRDAFFKQLEHGQITGPVARDLRDAADREQGQRRTIDAQIDQLLQAGKTDEARALMVQSRRYTTPHGFRERLRPFLTPLP